MKSTNLRSTFVGILALAIMNPGLVNTAQAGIAGTEAMVSTTRDLHIAGIQGQLERADVRSELARLGVDPSALDIRIANLSDSELATLSKQLQDAPAGGDVVAVIGVVFIVLIILELVGVIDIFKKNP